MPTRQRMKFTQSVFTMLLIVVLSSAVLPVESSTSVVLPGTDEWKTGFDGQRAWHHVAVLASDSLAGRYSGFQGSEKADRYISTHFKRLSMESPFGEDKFFHHFTYGAGEYAMPSSLIFHHDDGLIDTASMWQDFNIYKYSGFGKVRGKLVFAGYGISEPDKGWDEYDGLDVSGAVVLVMRNLPEVPDIKWTNERASGYKSTTALAKGAVGFIMTDDETPKLATISEKYYRKELPAVWISSILADSLLHETGKTKNEWMEEIKITRKPVSQALEIEVEMQVSGEYYPERPTRNIVAVLPGSDPELRHEAVLIGAHMDHHGVDAMGNCYPGADDNASGTATVMELAELFSKSTVSHIRSLMFAGFACEEEGLVGSGKLVEDLPIGDLKIVAMINMDMVGQGDGSIGVGGINEFPFLGELMFSDYPDSALKPLRFWGLGPGSDHASFRQAGIPSYTVGARGGHPNYHTPNDTVGAIKPEILKAVGEMVYHCAEALADCPEPLVKEVNKAGWLLHRSGGIEFMGMDTPYIPSFQRIKGVDYPTPVVFLNLHHGSDGALKLDDVLHNLETAREKADERFIPFMTDSLQKDNNRDSFKGLTAIIPANSLPNSSEAIKGLNRLGLSFVDLTELAGIKSHLNKKTIKKMTELAEKSKKASIRPIITNVDENIAIQTAEIWEGQVLYRVAEEKFDWERLADLADAGCFVLIVVDDDGEKGDFAALSERIKQALASDCRDNFGIIAPHDLVQALLDSEVENDDILDLLQDNIRRKLSKWWAKPMQE